MFLNDISIDWIGKVPIGWEIKRVKHLFFLKKEVSENPTDEKILSLTFGGIVVRDVSSNEGQLPETYNGYTKIYPNDIVMNPMDLRSGWVDKSMYEGIISPSYYVLNTGMDIVNIGYFNYQLQRHYKERIFFPFGQGVSYDYRWGMGRETLLNFPMLLPPQKTQSGIVSFLDNKTQKIDQLIDLTEKKIKLLKEQRTSLINHCITKGLNPNVEMKDSGIEWIGKIPSHWYRTKISRFCEVKDGTHDTPKFLDPNERTIPLVTSNSFINGEIDFTKSKHISIEDYTEINKRSDVQINDIIMSMIGSNIGNRVLVKTDSPFSIKNVCLFKTSKSVGLVPKYLLHLIDSKYLLYQVDFNQKGGGQPFLSLNELRNLIFPFPPENEQNQIVEHLDKLTQKVDTTIEIESQRIDLLKEYRQSLISEVVTGKIDVRDWKE
ncbi:MAG: restriction endonuclease subunit S [Candidatus Marinimicrobia bacterium]|jgi:type I restriction enzyme, S subunit|nr:restriction endonuclease subunit S [Candidatus Neomarinimicrobiota bacterium]